MNMQIRAVSPFFGAPVRNKSSNATSDEKTKLYFIDLIFALMVPGNKTQKA